MTDEVIVRVLQGRASDIERRQLLEWRNASPLNDRRYRDLAAVWTFTERQRPEGAILEPPGTADIVSRSRRRRRRMGEGAGWSRPMSRLLAAGAVVAAAALLIVGGVHWTERGVAEPEKGALFVTRELTTNASEMVTVRLDDGTIVRLGPESRLRFGGPSYGPREVSLDGKAYFAVAKDRERPFHVHTSAGEVSVLGTRFELQSQKKDLRLLVIQGLVEVDAGKGRVEVAAGQMSRVVEGAPPVVLPAVDAFSGVDEWVGQVIFFEATPLDQVAHELSEHYGREVVLEDPLLTARTVTASFINRSFEDVLTVVCRVADVRCATSGDSTTISR